MSDFITLCRVEAARLPIRAIDEVLDRVEELNLRRRKGERPTVPRWWLSNLERRVGAPLPQPVGHARDTVLFHGALLDWQEEWLDLLRPDRRFAYPDADEE